MNVADRLTQRADLRVIQLRYRARDQVTTIGSTQQLALRLGVGVAHRQAQQESIQLRIGQRERAGQVHRVLRGDHEEGIGQGMGLSVQGDLLFGHGLQQRTLRARGRAVDLVGQQHMGEHRSGVKLELTAAGLVHRHAQYIGRQQVGGELHALEGEAEAAGQCMRQCGLAEPGQIFDEQMPAGKQGDKRQPDFRHLAQHQCVDLILCLTQGLTQLIG
ncbi:hypothetical protein G6F40_014284 [Rhizopus arrhizus]|nr:hypothetical protein G6F40_014284 [Rhizopus arrhizus]